MPEEFRLNVRIDVPGGGREVDEAARRAERGVEGLARAAMRASRETGAATRETARRAAVEGDFAARARVSAAQEARLARSRRETAGETRRLARATREASAAREGLLGTGLRLRSVLGVAAFGVAAREAAQFARATVGVGVAMESLEARLSAAVGGSAAAAAEWGRLAGEAERLGVAFRPLVDGFAGVAAAARGTALEGEGVRTLVRGFSEAATVLQLTEDQLGGILTAVEQIISKGRVQAEEVLQISERLPGTYQLFARALGVTTAELSELLAQGRVGLPELERVGRQLQADYGPRLAGAVGTARAEFSRLSNAVEGLQDAVARSVLLDFLADAASFAARAVRALTPERAGRELAEIAAERAAAGRELAAATREYQEVLARFPEGLPPARDGADPASQVARLREEYRRLREEEAAARAALAAAPAAAGPGAGGPAAEGAAAQEASARETERILAGLARAEAARLDPAVRITREYEAQAAALRAEGALQGAALDAALERLAAERDARLADADARRLQAAAAAELAGIEERNAVARTEALEAERAAREEEAALRQRESDRFDRYDEELAAAEGFHSRREAEEAAHQQRLIEIEHGRLPAVAGILQQLELLHVQSGRQQVLTALDVVANAFTQLGALSGKAFRIAQAAAIAQTIISTISGAQEAFRSGLQIPAPAPIPQIAAATLAAAALASGYARVQQIRAQRRPQAFQFGGIVDEPTFFAARGLPDGGVAGEAGPEAIVPLRRRPDGGLGVAQPPAQLTVNLIQNAPGVEARATERRRADGGLDVDIQIDRVVSAALESGPRTLGALARLGVRPPLEGR